MKPPIIELEHFENNTSSKKIHELAHASMTLRYEQWRRFSSIIEAGHWFFVLIGNRIWEIRNVTLGGLISTYDDGYMISVDFTCGYLARATIADLNAARSLRLQMWP